MQKEFIPYEQALALKELGFDELCLAHYDEEILHENWEDPNLYLQAPLYQQAFRFFREKHSLLSEIGLRDREDLSTWKFEITVIGEYEMKHNSIHHSTYEEAELECLKKIIEIVKG